MKPLFAVLADVIRDADYALSQFGQPVAGPTQFDIAIMVRGINILKAVRVLAENGQWEIAASPTRQLFEILLNMESVNRSEDRDQATLTFAKFGLLQFVQARVEEMNYAMETGRAVSADELAKIHAYLNSGAFDEFKEKRGGAGTVRWAKSWNGMNARQMASLSSNPIRMAQYRQLFSRWSEEVHGAPGALIAAITRKADEGWIEELVADDDRRVAEMISMTIMLFIELVILLPHAPDLDPRLVLGWIAKLRDWTKQHFSLRDDLFRQDA